MNVSKKYKNLFIIIITMSTINLAFQTRDLRDLMIDLAIFTLGYLVLFLLLETLVASKTRSMKNPRK